MNVGKKLGSKVCEKKGSNIKSLWIFFSKMAVRNISFQKEQKLKLGITLLL